MENSRFLINFGEASTKSPLGEPDHWIKVPEGRVIPGCGGAISMTAVKSANPEFTSLKLS